MTDEYNELNNPVTKGMLALLSASMSGENKSCDFDLSLWPEIKKELNSQTVLPLVSDAVMECDISEKEKNEVLMETVVNIRTFHKLMKAQTAVFDLLKNENIPAAIMKGSAAAQYYVRPELRQFGDLDILVSPDCYRKAFDLLCSKGYENVQDYDAVYDRHIGFNSPEGIKVELHRYFSSSENKDQNALLDGWLFDKINNTVKINLNEYSVPAFPSLENGLILLGHINQHLSSGLGLRQITDWMMYVRCVLTDEFWKENFEEKAVAIGMDYLAKVVTKMCKKYLGLEEKFTWCDDAESGLADELMLYILKKGNFGKKSEIGTRSTLAVSHMLKNPIRFFKYLTDAGSVHMHEAGMKPRKVFAWIYQLRHLIIKTFRRKKKSKDIMKEIKCGINEADLMKKLKVTRN